MGRSGRQLPLQYGHEPSSSQLASLTVSLYRSLTVSATPLDSLSSRCKSTSAVLGRGKSHWCDIRPWSKHHSTVMQVGSILAGFIMLVGPISSLLVNKFGPRKTCIAGAFLSAISIFVSTFSPNVYMLMVGQFYNCLNIQGYSITPPP